MKTRSSLVSNSSATSFIILYKKQNKCKCCGRGQSHIEDIINEKNTHNDDYQVYGNNVSDIKDKIISDFYNDDTKKEILEKIDSCESEQDLSILYFKISMHDDDMIEMINSIEKTGGKILYKCSD
jgi:hypothetical protein